MDFFDTAFTYSNHTSKVTCCHKNNTLEVATCGQGASCAGQCSALGASLCPSGNCTDDPRTCDLDFSRSVEDGQGGGSTATYTGSDLSFCTNSKHQCRVRKYKDCCYNPNCLEWKGRRDACSWLNYLTGKSQSLIYYYLPFLVFPHSQF